MSLYKEIKKVPEAIRLKTKIEIYNLILQKQTIQQTQPLSVTESFPSNNASTSFVQPLNRPLAYPQYAHTNDYTYTTTSYDTRRNNDHILSNQNRVPTNYTTIPYEMRQDYVNTQKNQKADTSGSH